MVLGGSTVINQTQLSSLSELLLTIWYAGDGQSTRTDDSGSS